jgi:hypothetical protein
MDFSEIEYGLNDLVNACNAKLNNAIINSVYELIEAREYGLALEELSNFLFEYDVKIDLSFYKKLEEIGLKMSMDTSSWDFLEKLIEKRS